MSALIKGMEMPETCGKCRMNVAMFLFSDGPIGHCMLLKGRADKRKCPLVPVPTPHGRLVDAGAVIDAIDLTDWYHQNGNKDIVHGANSAEHQAWFKAQDVYTAITNVPTIIEAEGEE